MNAALERHVPAQTVLHGVAALADRIDLAAATWWVLGAAFLAWPFWGFEVTQIGATGVTAASLLGALGVVLWSLHLLLGGRGVRIDRGARWAAWLLAAVVLSYAGMIADGAPPDAKPVRTALHLLFLLALMAAWATMDVPPARLLRLFRLWVWLSVPICAFGIYQMFARAFHLPFAWLELTNVSLLRGGEAEAFQQLSIHFGRYFRATSIFSEPGTLGYFCTQTLLMIGTATALGQGATLIRSRALRGCVIALLVLTLFVTYSLGALASLVFAAALVAAVLRRAGRRRYLAAVAALLVVLAAADLLVLKPTVGISVGELILDRARGIVAAGTSDSRAYAAGESFESRLQAIRTGAHIWSEYPITGAGLGRYGKVSRTGFYSDAFYLRVLAELGLFGLAVLLAFLGSLIVRLWRAARRQPRAGPEGVLLCTLCFLFVVQLEMGWMSDFLFFDQFWALVGMALMLLARTRPTDTVHVAV